MGFYNPHFYILQVGGFRLIEMTKRQKLTRSLFSGLEKSLLTNSESEGASYDPVPCPSLICSVLPRMPSRPP